MPLKGSGDFGTAVDSMNAYLHLFKAVKRQQLCTRKILIEISSQLLHPLA